MRAYRQERGPLFHERQSPLREIRSPIGCLDAVRDHVRRVQPSVADAGQSCRMLGYARLLVECFVLRVSVRSCRYEGRLYRLRMAFQFRRSGRSQMSFLGLS